MDAYSQIDERRRFTETVLAGVSAGVIGLDAQGRIELPNRAASELLGADLMAAIGRPLQDVVPEFAPLLASARQRRTGRAPPRSRSARSRRRTLLVRIGAEPAAPGGPSGFVVHVRRHHRAAIGAAQGGVGRRGAAHRPRDQEPADPDPAFGRAAQAALHQGDHLRPGNVRAMRRHHRPARRRHRPHGGRVLGLRADAAAGDQGRRTSAASRARRWCCSAAPVRRSNGSRSIPERGPVAPCDRRLIGQALTNLLQNAADAVAMRPRGPGRAGRIVAHQDGVVRRRRTADRA